MNMTVREHFGCGGVAYENDPEFLVGIECEIEGVRHPDVVGIFKPIPDGSLRNNGIEYVSQPAHKKELLDQFKYLHESLEFIKGVDPFSIRTSTHVHVNCLGLTLVEARTLVLLYALFEECFFLMVKPARRDNIHCVPLTETPLPAQYKRDIRAYHQVWSKYTALNLKRLSDLGTMEFRHLHGTNDVAELDAWLSCLENMWKLCKRTTISKETLTKENIMFWFDCVFAPSAVVMAMRHSLFDIIRNSLIDVKFSTV